MKLLLPIILLLFNVSIIAQNNFDYKAYKAPQYRFQALNMNLDLGGGYNSSGSESPIPRSESNIFNSNNSLGYSRIINNDSIQYILGLFGEGRYDYNQFKNINKYKRNGFGLSTSVSMIRRKYTEGLKFKEFGGQLSSAYINTAQTNFPSTKYLYSALSLPFKLGKGRIDPASTLFVANFIMDDLLQSSILQTPFTQDQLFEMARLIQSVQYQRVLDYRRSFLNQFNQIGQWLKLNIPNEADLVNAMAIMQDNLFYAIDNSRSVGKRKGMGFVGLVNYDDNFFEKTLIEPQFSLGAELFYSKTVSTPRSQSMHLDDYFVVGGGYQKRIDIKDQLPYMYARQVRQHSYFPNSRTRYSIFADLEFNALYGPGREVNQDNLSLRISPAVRFELSYFLSYNTRIGASLDMRYNRIIGGGNFLSLNRYQEQPSDYAFFPSQNLNAGFVSAVEVSFFHSFY